MAVEKIQVPDLGTDETVEVIEVQIKAGDRISENDTLVVLESDKAAMDIPAPKAGVVKKVLVEVGAQVKTGSPLLELEADSDNSAGSDDSDNSADSDSDDSDKAEQSKAAAAKDNQSAASAKASEPEPASKQENKAAANGGGLKAVHLPDLGSDEAAEVIEVLVKVGDEVDGESGLITLETDKAAMDVPASVVGVIKALKVKVGDKVKTGDHIADVELSGDGKSRTARQVSTGDALVIGDIEKMSKSKKNVVAPEEILEAYGVDAGRLFVLSDSPPERDVQWTSGGVEGAGRFVNRVWAEIETEPAEAADPGQTDALRRATHKAIKAVTEGLEHFRFNSAIARLYAFLNDIRAAHGAAGEARSEALKALTQLIAPFVPHLAEECWTRLGHEGMVVEAAWPIFDPALAADEELVLPVQINGKRRGEVRAPRGMAEAEVEKLVRADPEIAARLDGLTVRKVIVVKDRIVNLVAG